MGDIAKRIDPNKITFDKPASVWEEALPIGNGRLGGMVYGLIDTERIQLNEDSVWFGGPRDRINPSAKEELSRIRELIMKGEIEKAQELCAFALSAIPEEQRHYEPLGDLYLEFDLPGRRTAQAKDAVGNAKSGEYSDYYRELDLQRAVVTTRFCIDGVTYQREVFSSYPHQAMVIHITADKPGMLSFHTQLGRGNRPWDLTNYRSQSLRRTNYSVYTDQIRALPGNRQIMTAQTGGGGVSMAACSAVVAKGGTCRTIGASILVEGADEAMVVLTADTTFRKEDPAASCAERADRVAQISWETLLAEHEADHRKLYDRVHLEIPGQEEVVRFFDFGRYLLIASSRPGSLPANLQGLWNQDYAPAWGSKYTININAEMNYWPAMVCNLPECQEPLLDLLERMKASGREVADRMYGCRGFMAHHNTDIWGDCAPQDVCLSATYWVMGAAWLSLHIWEQYLFLQDIDFLRVKYATMREAALFLLDYLIEDGDYLVTCPTLSPENTYILPNGQQGVICKGATMDNQIIRELFTACIRAEEILKDDLSETEKLAPELEKVLQKIAPTRIGKYGQIMEWNEDYEELEPGHRHISQLFGLYPGSQITKSGTPELTSAAAKTLERRLSSGGGHSGWSRAWIINLYARLGMGDEAAKHICRLISTQTLPNLFDDHPPFQIDGNFGCAAGIAEMLVQSHEEEIRFLPALPKEWKDGKVSGLRLRGGKTLKTLEWRDGQVIKAEVE